MWITPRKRSATRGLEMPLTSEPRSGLNYFVVLIWWSVFPPNCAALIRGYPCISPIGLEQHFPHKKRQNPFGSTLFCVEIIDVVRRTEIWITPRKRSATRGLDIPLTSQPRSGLNYYVVLIWIRTVFPPNCAALIRGYSCISPIGLSTIYTMLHETIFDMLPHKKE